MINKRCYNGLMQTQIDDNVVFGFMFVLLVLIVWTMFWKAVGLWHAARKGDTVWFVVFLAFNTLGILELIYLHNRGKLKRGKLLSKSK